MSPLTLKKMKLGFEQGGQTKAEVGQDGKEEEEQERWQMEGHLTHMRRTLGGGGEVS